MLHRLAEREGQCAPSGAGVSAFPPPTAPLHRSPQHKIFPTSFLLFVQPSTFRRFYENVVPSVALTGIEPPTGTCIARFTPCGRYLVTFDAPANEVVLYAFMGMPGTPTLENASPEVNAPDPTPSPEASSPRRRAGGNHGIKFSDIFARHVRCGLATAAEEQLFAFCLVVHGEYLILATTAPDMRPLEPEGHWLGVSESVTFYLVELSSGEIKDKLSIRGDGLDLSHHSAASLHDDMMAVLAPGQQTIFILQVLPEGTLRMKCTLGRWCSSDDAAVALEQEQKEREESNGAREAGGQDPRDGSGAFQENWLHDSNGDGEDSEPASPPPPPSTEPVAGPFIEGIKQRMLAHMYLTALSEAEDSAATTAEGGAAAGTGSLPEAESSSAVKGSAYGLGGGVHALQTFYFYYRVYLELDMHRVQLLDRQRLLISWLPRTQASAEGGSHRTALLRGLQCVYNMETTLVEKVLGGGSQAFHDW